MIFQTEKQLSEYGEKLSAGNKTAIEGALADLKKAHESKDLAAIDSAMESINAAWQAASQEMYAATGGQPGADGADFGSGQPGGNAGGNGQSSNNADTVTDVDYEEVK